MSNDNYAPWPEGYQTLEVAEISHVAYKPETKQAIILFESTVGLKVALVADLSALNRALLQLQSDPLQTRVGLVAHDELQRQLDEDKKSE